MEIYKFLNKQDESKSLNKHQMIICTRCLLIDLDDTTICQACKEDKYVQMFRVYNSYDYQETVEAFIEITRILGRLRKPTLKNRSKEEEQLRHIFNKFLKIKIKPPRYEKNKIEKMYIHEKSGEVVLITQDGVRFITSNSE